MCRRLELARDIVRVHAFSLEHVAKGYAGGDERNALKLLRSPWFDEFSILGKHWELDGPLWTLEPGGPIEGAGAISYRLMKRWRENPTVPMRCFRATKRCHGIFGGQRRKLGTSAAHHLGLSAAFLALKAAGQSQGWQLEDARFLPMRSKRPDAFLGDSLIDFGGCYSSERILQLHSISCNWGRPLQVW